MNLQEGLDILAYTGATIQGILLLCVLALSWAVTILWKRCKTIQEGRLKEQQKYHDTIVELAQKTIVAIQQVTELAKKN